MITDENIWTSFILERLYIHKKALARINCSPETCSICPHLDCITSHFTN